MTMDPGGPSSPERPVYETPSEQAITPPQAPPPAGFSAQVSVGSTNGFAIASLVLGIIGIMGLPPIIPSILALIFGYKAKGQIDRSNGLEQGRGLAIAGIVLGWIAIVFAILFAILAVALFAIPVSFGN
jgi:hypothetical protein